MSGEYFDPIITASTPSPTNSHASQCSSHSSPPPPNSSATSSPPSSKPTKTTSFPSRDDCWSPAATFTLIEEWGHRYLQLNRGSLRQNHWHDVAAAVNSLHRHTSKLPRTDVQCKNRIDTVKKKFKIEKSRVSNSAGRYISPWPFFDRLDSLIGDSFKPSPAFVSNRRKITPALPPPPSAVPVRARSKRPLSGGIQASGNGAVAKRKFLAIAAEQAERSEEEFNTSWDSFRDGTVDDGCWQIAEAIGRFGEIYKRIEEDKLRQMIELEKQRMLFAKDLEIQRVKLIGESQVQLARIKRAERFMKGSRNR